MGHVDWSLAANYNRTKVTARSAPAPLGNLGALLGPTALTDLETASPRLKVIGGALWSMGKLTVNLRETIYGKSSEVVSPDGSGAPPNFTTTIGTTRITDLDVAYQLTPSVRIAAGANNLFDHKPGNLTQFTPAGGLSDGSNIYDAPLTFSPFGINGGYYYARVVVSF